MGWTCQEIDLAVKGDFVITEESTAVIHLKRHAGSGVQARVIASGQSWNSAQAKGKFMSEVLNPPGRNSRRQTPVTGVVRILLSCRCVLLLELLHRYSEHVP